MGTKSRVNDVTPIPHQAETSNASNVVVMDDTTTADCVADKRTENADFLRYKLHGSSLFQRAMAHEHNSIINGAKPLTLSRQLHETIAAASPRPRPITQGSPRGALQLDHKAATPRTGAYDSADEYLKKSKRLIKYYADPKHQPRTSPVNHSCFQPLRTRERRHANADEKIPDADADLHITSSYVVAPSNERLQVDCHDGSLLMTQRNVEIFDYLGSTSSMTSAAGSSGATRDREKDHEATNRRVLCWVQHMSMTTPYAGGFDVIGDCTLGQSESDRVVDTLDGSAKTGLCSN